MRRHAPQLYRVPNEAPISDLNTTPLIDVMLVLLIMFIITVPIATHKVAIDLPAGEGAPYPIIHRLDQAASGLLTLDGAPIREAQLPMHLAVIKANPAAQLHFRPDATTRYEDFDRVLASVKGAGITSLGLVDNARFAHFGK